MWFCPVSGMGRRFTTSNCKAWVRRIWATFVQGIRECAGFPEEVGGDRPRSCSSIFEALLGADAVSWSWSDAEWLVFGCLVSVIQLRILTAILGRMWERLATSSEIVSVPCLRQHQALVRLRTECVLKLTTRVALLGKARHRVNKVIGLDTLLWSACVSSVTGDGMIHHDVASIEDLRGIALIFIPLTCRDLVEVAPSSAHGFVAAMSTGHSHILEDSFTISSQIWVSTSAWVKCLKLARLNLMRNRCGNLVNILYENLV